MRITALISFFLLFALTTQSQTTIFNGSFSIREITGSSPSYTVDGFFQSEGTYIGTDIQEGDRIYFWHGNDCDYLVVDTVYYAYANIVNLGLSDPDTTFLSIPTGKGLMTRLTDYYNFSIPFTADVPDVLKKCVGGKLINEIDQIRPQTSFYADSIFLDTTGLTFINDTVLQVALEQIDSALFDINDSLDSIPRGSGTANQWAYWLDANTLTTSNYIVRDATRLTLNAPVRLQNLPTISLPGVPSSGDLLYNTTTGNLSFYGSSTWEYPLKTAFAGGLLGSAQAVAYADANRRVTSTAGFRYAGSTTGLVVGSIQFNGGGASTSETGQGFAAEGANRTFRFLASGSNSTTDKEAHLFNVGSITRNNTTSWTAFRYNVVQLAASSTITDFRVASDTLNLAKNLTILIGREYNPNFNGFTVTNHYAQIWRSGWVGIGVTPTQAFHVEGNARVTGAIYDSNDDPGSVGQILSSTVTGTDWIDAPTGYTGFTPAADSGSGSNVASAGTLTLTGGYGTNTSVTGTTVTVEADTSKLATQSDLSAAIAGISTIYTADGFIENDRYIELPLDKSFAIGNFPNFPDRFGDRDELGFYKSVNNEEIGFVWADSLTNRYASVISQYISNEPRVTLSAADPDGVGTNSLYVTPQLVRITTYGDNNKTADDLSKTRSGLVLAPATDGTVYETGGILFTQTTTDTVTNTASETSLINTGVGTTTLPADYLEEGRDIKCEAWGTITTNGSPPSLELNLKLGSTAVWGSGSFSMIDLSAGIETWHANISFTTYTEGVSGTVMPAGEFSFFVGGDPSFGKAIRPVYASPVTINTTTSQTIDFTATWGSADINASIVMTKFVCKAEN